MLSYPCTGVYCWLGRWLAWGEGLIGDETLACFGEKAINSINEYPRLLDSIATSENEKRVANVVPRHEFKKIKVLEQARCSSHTTIIEAGDASDEAGHDNPIEGDRQSNDNAFDDNRKERITSRVILLCRITRRNNFVKEVLAAHPIARELTRLGKSIQPPYANDATVLVSDATIDVSAINSEERSSWRQCNLIVLPEALESVTDALHTVAFRSRPKLTVVKEIPVKERNLARRIAWQ